MEISVHDNIIYSYLVVCEDFSSELYTLTLYTEYHYNPEATEYTDIIFLGVIAHHFEEESSQNVIFDIKEYNLEESYKENEALFTRLKGYSWPIKYEDVPELIESLKTKNVKPFQIMSSSGIRGWIWAEEMHLKRREERHQFS